MARWTQGARVAAGLLAGVLCLTSACGAPAGDRTDSTVRSPDVKTARVPETGLVPAAGPLPAVGPLPAAGPLPSATGPLDELAPGLFYRPPTPLVAAAPGTLIRWQAIPLGAGFRRGSRAYRVLYHSRSATGTDVAVSGMVVVPGGTPPSGGFPIVDWAHGTTGLAIGCAPSLQGTASIPLLHRLVAAGDAVAATDYQGLGSPGTPSYLDGPVEGVDVLDVAEAARALDPARISGRVVVLGYSEGGQAALFAGQMAGADAPGLTVAGVVAVAPVADVTELAPLTRAGHGEPGTGFAVMAAWAWSQTDAGFPLDQVLTRSATGIAAELASGCSGAAVARFATIPVDRVFEPGWSAVPAVRATLDANRPGYAPLRIPTVVVQGTADRIVPLDTTRRLFVDRLCRAEHDPAALDVVAGATHDSVLGAASGTILTWVARRLAGEPARTSCPR